MENKFFVHQIKGKGNTITDKGIVVKDTMEAAKQTYHAYLGAYAYGQNADVDFVSCHITDVLSGGMILDSETWLRTNQEGNS